MSPIPSTATGHRPDPGQLLDRAVPVVPGQQVGGHLLQHGDLAGQPADQLPQRGHLPGVRLGQGQLIQPLRSPGAEDVRAGHLDAELGQHAVDLVLAAGADVHQLAAVPGDLPQLADLRRGDPRLRQPAHPQQVGQVAGIALVVLDPAAGEGLDSQRVCQVHLGTSRRQRIRRPVPAVAGLQHHLRVQARPLDLCRQPRRAVGDPRAPLLHGIRVVCRIQCMLICWVRTHGRTRPMRAHRPS